MKVSLNWVKEYTNIDIEVEALVEKIGSQIGAIEDVIDLARVYKNVYIIRIVSCVPHPKADKLSLCKIDDGHKMEGVERDDNGFIQVVCGAPNVRENLLAVWIPPGATVPSTFHKNPFVLESKDLRGKVSNGMLASPKELAVSDSHEGLLEMPNDAVAGQLFAEYYSLNDTIIDIENKMLTHRPDLFGQIGIARELAGVTHKEFVSPDWYKKVKNLNMIQPNTKLSVKNEIPDLVPRFMAQAITGVTVKPSSARIQSYLTRVGLRPINNIVDFTNYFMFLTAQPLHAYDLDKLARLDNSDKASILIRKANEDEKLHLLNGKEIKLNGSEIVIATNTKAIGLGGVMGGSETEVDRTTKNIILECANFDMYAIRRTAMAHGLFTDAVSRFNKGQSPYQNDRVLNEIITEILADAGGVVETPIDIQTQLPTPVSLKVSTSLINDRLGLNLSNDQMAVLLNNVEFKVSTSGDELDINVPFWRTDIHIAEDVVEEIGRLYGYDNLILSLPARTIEATPKDKLMSFKSSVRDILVKAGANEVLTYNFVGEQLLGKVGQNPKLAYRLGNPLSPDLEYYRMSLTPSLLEKVHPNIKAGFHEFAIFELNKTHIYNDPDPNEPDLPAESNRFSLVYAVDDKLAGKEYSGAPFFQAKFYASYLLNELGVKFKIIPLATKPEREDGKQLLKPFESIRTALIEVDGMVVGVVGEPNASVRDKLKLPKYCAMVEMVTTGIIDHLSTNVYSKLSPYQYAEQDICFKLRENVNYENLHDFLYLELEKIAPYCQLVLTPIDIFQRSDEKDYKQVTFRLRINSFEKTLTSVEVNAIINLLAAEANQKYKALLI